MRVYVRVCVFILSAYSCERVCIHVGKTSSSRGGVISFSFFFSPPHSPFGEIPFFERTILVKRTDAFRADARFRARFPSNCTRKLFYTSRYMRYYTVCGTQLVPPGHGGILLSVRVSREDDNAHGIAVASFGPHPIARQDEVRGIVVLCADSSGNARR